MSSGFHLYHLLARVARNPSRDGYQLGRTSLLGEITRVVGADIASKLAADFGGRRLYIPQTPADGDKIVRSIGMPAAMRLARMCGGDRVMIPAHPERALRRAQIIALRERGLSVSRIARSAGCTERYVYKVLSSKKQG